jgi:DNA-binding PadR family transcriptional regulator
MKKAASSRPRKTVKAGAAKTPHPAAAGVSPKRRFTRVPVEKTTLMHGLLGLIAEQPEISGYDIMKLFDLQMAHYWHALPGQIYPTLDEMLEIGLITSRDVVQSGRPNKRLFKITPAGERKLVSWLQSPPDEMRLKQPSLLRCRFLGNLGADGAREMLEEERFGWEQRLRVYHGLERDYFSGGRAARSVNAMFAWFTLKRGITWMEESIRWCDWAIAEIENNRELFPEADMRAGLEPLLPYNPSKYFPPRISYDESLRMHANDVDVDDDDEEKGK